MFAVSALQPLPDSFAPNWVSNLAQHHFATAGLSPTGTLPQGLMAWKSGYPAALSPYSYFIWYEEIRNSKANVLPETYNGPCLRSKTRWRVFVIDNSVDPPRAVDVTSQACDFNVENRPDSGREMYDLGEFSVEQIFTPIAGAGNAVDFDACDCELPAFFPDPTLSYGHTDAVEVFSGSGVTLDFGD